MATPIGLFVAPQPEASAYWAGEVERQLRASLDAALMASQAFALIPDRGYPGRHVLHNDLQRIRSALDRACARLQKANARARTDLVRSAAGSEPLRGRRTPCDS